ncbi:histidine phosphatase family protein [Candidatus Uhrbacteria bacterium]|nr:histidine phosphatase family protein [Candidatus Uhrbacteria bacterium]
MKRIIFIRTAEYQYKQQGLSLYDSLDAIGLQAAQPPITPPSDATRRRVNALLHRYRPTQIFCSEFIRSGQTAKLFSLPVNTAPQLNEIKFSMNDFSTHRELSSNTFEPSTINLIRYNFSLALLSDALYEKQASIMGRISECASILCALSPNTTALCCSHGFIMKLYENFFRNMNEPHIFEQIVTAHDWSIAPYGFTEGFIVELSDTVVVKNLTDGLNGAIV